MPFNLVMEMYEDEEGYFWMYRSCYAKGEDACFKDLFFFHSITFDTLNFEERFGDTAPFEPIDIKAITANKAGSKFCIQTTSTTYSWSLKSGFEALPENWIVLLSFVCTTATPP